MKTICLPILCMLLVLALPLSLPAQTIDVELIPTLVIGDDENAAEEYLFANPKFIVTDQDGNIYVADQNRANVRVFDRNGTFLTALGARGQGPGHFQEITCMTTNDQNDLIVADRRNRRFTRFVDRGKDFVVYPFPDQEAIDPFIIAPLGDDAYLLYYLKNNRRRARDQEFGDLIHIYNQGFSYTRQSLAPAEEIWDLRQPALRTQPGSPFLKLAVIDAHNMVVVPELYEGVLSLYQRQDSGWHSTTLHGKTPRYASYEPYEMNLPASADFSNLTRVVPPNVAFFAGPEGRITIRRNNISSGVFALPNGLILHFSLLKTGDERRDYGIEIFDKASGYLGYHAITSDFNPYAQRRPLTFRPYWIGKDNLLYGVAYPQAFPVIEISKIKLALPD